MESSWSCSRSGSSAGVVNLRSSPTSQRIERTSWDATGSGDSSPATTSLARRSDTSAATMCRFTRPHIFQARRIPRKPDASALRSRFFAMTHVSAAGAYRLRALPPATYFVAVIDRSPCADEDAWQDATSLERLTRDATLVTLTNGQHTSLDLKLFPR